MSEKLQNRKGGVFPVFKSNCDTLSASPEKAMAPHSSTLAWKIPWTEEPGRLQSMGSLRVGQDFHFSFSCIGEENGNPLQCSCLENPRDGGACGLPSMGSHRVRHDWSDLAAAASASFVAQLVKNLPAMQEIQVLFLGWEDPLEK